MALTIYTNKGNSLEYYIPFERNNPLLTMMAMGVDQVAADGDELEYIQQRFGNKQVDNRSTIPFPSTFSLPRIVRWYGDHAKFIVGNLT